MFATVLFFLLLNPTAGAQEAADPHHVVKFDKKQLVFNNGVRLTVMPRPPAAG